MSQVEQAVTADSGGIPPVEADSVDIREDVDSGGESTLESMEDIVSALEKAEAESNAPPEDGRGEEEAEAQGAEADTSVEVEAPASWSDEDKALMASLPPELRQSLTRREAERERVVQARAEEAHAARQAHDNLHQWASSTLGAAVEAAKIAVEADFANVDWLGLQKNDPATFLQLDAMRQERLAGLERAMSQQQALAQHERQQHQARYGQHLQSELATALPAVQKVMGQGFEAQSFKKDLSEYLTGIGAPREHINDIGYGYQLVMATKAMMYDKMEKSRESAARKVAEAPKVQGTKARLDNAGGKEAEVRRARAALDRNPNSKDNLVRLLMAEG